MRAELTTSTFVLLAVMACNSPTPTEMTGASSYNLTVTSNRTLRPLSGRCEAAMQQPIFVSPGVIRQVDVGTCQLSHLGRVSFYSSKLINTTAGTQTTQASFTAANGDSIYATGSGTNVPSGTGLVSFQTNLEFISGTGRFENVTGEAQVVGEANLITRRSTLKLEGSITYARSN